MNGHVLLCLILDSLSAILNNLNVICFAEASFALPGTMIVTASVIGMYGKKEVWYIMGRCNVNVT